MTQNLFPLGKVTTVIESAKLEVSYVYEDLVFVESIPFILRFDKNDATKVYVHFNVDCEEDSRVFLENQLMLLSKENGLVFEKSSTVEIVPNEENETLDLVFDSE